MRHPSNNDWVFHQQNNIFSFRVKEAKWRQRRLIWAEEIESFEPLYVVNVPRQCEVDLIVLIPKVKSSNDYCC